MRTNRIAGLLLAGLLLVQPVCATQVQQLSVEELGTIAAKVVRGKVETTRSFWNPEHTKIYTEVVLATDETYKGGATGTVRVLQLGGTVDGVRVTVHGALGWTPNEEVLLFLEPYKDDQYVVSGLSQGKFNIVRDPRTQEAYVTRVPLDDVELMGPDGAKALPASFEKTPLTQFIHKALGNVPERHQD